MLFKQEHLQGIQSGTVTKAFRKWAKPVVKNGSQIKTSIGVVEVIAIVKCKLSEIREIDAVQAGYQNLKSLSDLLNKIPLGDIFCITVRYKSADPRLELREQTTLSDEELELLKNKVARLDQFSKQGSWTILILNAIRNHPKLKAADLAKKTGKEKDWLKLNIRKLKNLGLTISYEPGYTLSPLGMYFLDHVQADRPKI